MLRHTHMYIRKRKVVLLSQNGIVQTLKIIYLCREFRMKSPFPSLLNTHKHTHTHTNKHTHTHTNKHTHTQINCKIPGHLHVFSELNNTPFLTSHFHPHPPSILNMFWRQIFFLNIQNVSGGR